MSRPLIITDCDEVLLHMLVPFRDWLDEDHGVHLDMHQPDFVDALRHKDTGEIIGREQVWNLLIAFFDSQMHRQHPIAGAMEALGRLSEQADIVVLTNIGERHHEGRIDQLAAQGLHVPVFWNQGRKGRQLKQIIEARRPSVALFIDDIAEHHESVKDHAPQVWRLQLVGEPEVAPIIPPAPYTHARIDDWAGAERWIAERLAQGPAPIETLSKDGFTP